MTTTDAIPSNISPETSAVNADNPWPGLLPYQEQDQAFFYGRENESVELLRLVMRETLTILFGLSGLGKTSLLQAGLFPPLRRQYLFPIYIRFGFSPDLPSLSRQVKQAIVSQGTAVGTQIPEENGEETLWEYFHRRNADFWSDRNRLLLPVLVFDQFEEIFTLGRLDEDRVNDIERFLNELADLIEGRPPASLKEHLDKYPSQAGNFSFTRHHYKVLLCLREDFLAELEGLRERMPSIINNRMRLYRFTGLAALQVVSHARHLIEREVAELVVRFVAAAEHTHLPFAKLELEPALLSVVCRELNHKRQQRRDPQITGDLLEGSQQEILSAFYESSISDLSQAVRAFVEEKLLTVSGYRDSVALENALSSPGVTSASIDLLVHRRLIRIDERGGAQRLELTHDLLTGVIAASRDGRRQFEAEQQRAKEISEKDRQRRLEERARNARRLLWLSAGLAMLFLFAVFAFYRAKQQSQRAQQQHDSARKETIRAEKQLALAEREREQARKDLKLATMQRVQAENERKLAETARIIASDNAKLANQTLQKKRAVDKLRQALLSMDKTVIKEALKTAPVETQIKFRVTEKEFPYRCINGSTQKKYQMFPNVPSILGGLQSIAVITYIMDNPTFENPLISAGPYTEFKGTYDGCGCIPQVTAVIEYTDPDKPLSVAKFEMCNIIEKVK